MSMRSRQRGIGGAAAAVLAVTLASGCTFIADLPDVGPSIPACDDGDPMEVRDLWVVLEGMRPHLDQYAELRLVNEQGFVVAVAVYDGIPAEDFTVFLKRAVVGGGLRLDFWADYTENRVYDPPTEDATGLTDHSWRLPECVSGAYRFTHAGNFTDLSDPPLNETGKRDAILQLRNFTPAHQGQTVTLYVRDRASDRIVGFYRLKSVATGEEALIIPRIVEPGSEYDLAFYADVNETGEYENGTDHSWVRTELAGASGILLEFSHAPPFDDITDYVKP